MIRRSAGNACDLYPPKVLLKPQVSIELIYLLQDFSSFHFESSEIAEPN